MQPHILGIIVHIKLLFRKASTSSHCYSEIFSLNHKMIPSFRVMYIIIMHTVYSVRSYHFSLFPLTTVHAIKPEGGWRFSPSHVEPIFNFVRICLRMRVVLTIRPNPSYFNTRRKTQSDFQKMATALVVSPFARIGYMRFFIFQTARLWSI